MYKLQIQDLKVKESRFFVIPVFFPISLRGISRREIILVPLPVIPAKAGIYDFL